MEDSWSINQGLPGGAASNFNPSMDRESQQEEGKVGGDEQSTGAGDDEEVKLTEEGDEGDEDGGDEQSTGAVDKEVESESEGVGKQAEKTAKDSEVKKDREDDMVVGDENAEEYTESRIGERDEEAVESEVESEKVDDEGVPTPVVEEEARNRRAEKEVEAEIVVIDDVTS
ncbi:major centromere autoantigen B-like [Salvia splendens]|uniref:major centromere autoantigen B-like n=1 Tax=Salvia splendens TaxID=180675 RepID=UPI001C26E868|nr:major centromere autoantigen B-like [Salvia splendens]